MNVVEKYAEQITKLQMNWDLFAQNVIEMCPREGVQNLKGYKESLKNWFPRLQKIEVKNIICKPVEINNRQELHGVVFLDVFYKVKTGEARINAVHVVQANEDGKIFLVNSFWSFSQFEDLMKAHPDLKNIEGNHV